MGRETTTTTIMMMTTMLVYFRLILYSWSSCQDCLIRFWYPSHPVPFILAYACRQYPKLSSDNNRMLNTHFRFQVNTLFNFASFFFIVRMSIRKHTLLFIFVPRDVYLLTTWCVSRYWVVVLYRCCAIFVEHLLFRLLSMWWLSIGTLALLRLRVNKWLVYFFLYFRNYLVAVADIS